MILLQFPSVYPIPLRKPLQSFLSPNAHLCANKFKFNLSSKAPFKCSCSKNENTHEASSQGFSVLELDIPWDSGSVWSTMAFYMFSLHIPLSFGGLSVVAQILHQPDLDPQTKALSLLVLQIIELSGTLLLLKWTAKPQFKFERFFKGSKILEKRNWLMASSLGFGFIFLLASLTSILADRFIGPKDVNPILKEILLSSDISKAACVLVYCIVTPLLEETVYRGFLLTSISSTMKWQQAIFISSVIFSAAHFSGENSLQLFIIGCVLGCSYCWTGNLSSSIAIHSLYNAMTLLVTFLS